MVNPAALQSATCRGGDVDWLNQELVPFWADLASMSWRYSLASLRQARPCAIRACQVEVGHISDSESRELRQRLLINIFEGL